jgi:membrane-associated protease RseP (regulator of RpoE activity)
MEFILSGLHYALSFVFILSVIVFIHEFGHYFVARL